MPTNRKHRLRNASRGRRDGGADRGARRNLRSFNHRGIGAARGDTTLFRDDRRGSHGPVAAPVETARRSGDSELHQALRPWRSPNFILGRQGASERSPREIGTCQKALRALQKNVERLILNFYGRTNIYRMKNWQI